VLTCSLVQEVGEQAAQDGLMADDQNVLLPLQLHDSRFQALHQVLVRLEEDRGRSWTTARETTDKLYIGHRPQQDG